MSGLEGHNALVTGGGSGLGLACATRLRADGATVTLAGRSATRLAAAAESLRTLHAPGEVRWTAADVTNEAEMEAAAELASAGGGLSVVVTSAGTGWLAPVATIPLEAWRNVLDVNVTGTFLALKHASPRMRACGGGSFVALSSVSGALAAGFLAAYATAKAAVDALVRVAAEELGAWNIRVNSVLPGLVPTELTAGIVDDAEALAEHLDNTPLRRLGTGEDVAAAVRFLAGPEAGWITGVNLAVDGGGHLRRAPRFDGYVRREHGTEWLPDR